jgi:PTK7 protein tyrosine kinase 7
MPHEAVFEDEYSTKSDVWSFACLMWEMLYAGELPFSRHSDEAVLSLLRNRELQWRPPKSTPEPLIPLLRACWSDSPRDRPSFSEVVQLFDELCLDSQI